MIRIRCLECREVFHWDYVGQGAPETCPICLQYIGSDDKDEVAAPFISMASRKSPDRVYRDMETTSANRAQMAAEMTGMSDADLSHLKMTNLKDGLREGDTAFSNNLSPTAQAMESQATFFNQNSLAIQASAGTNQGPVPRAGTNYIQNVLKPNHSRQHNLPVTNHPSIEFWKPR